MYFLMKITNMRLVFQNNAFLAYFPVKKSSKMTKTYPSSGNFPILN